MSHAYPRHSVRTVPRSTRAPSGLCRVDRSVLAAAAEGRSLPKVLRSAGVFDFAPTVIAVTGGFGRIWKVRTEGDLRDYVEVNRPQLASILLFELAHEGQVIPEMERAAEVGGVQAAFKC